MAKIRDINEAINAYSSEYLFEYFKLEDDRDTEVVRFLIGDKLIAEEDWFVVHELEIDGKKRLVQCTEEADCPCCVGGSKHFIKLLLQAVTKSDGKLKVWERGKTFVPILNGLITKYGPLCNRPYEIERFGKKDSQKTTYEFYPLDRDDRRLDELGVEKINIMDGENGHVLQLSYNQMKDAMDGRYHLPKQQSSGRDDRRGGRDDRDSRDDRGRDRDRGRDSRDDRRGRDEEPPRRRERSNTDVF